MLFMVRSTSFLVSTAFFFVAVPLSAAPGEDHGHGHDHASQVVKDQLVQAIEDGVRRKKVGNPAAGFSRYEKKFIDLCRGLAGDGRRETLVTIATELSGFQPGCGSCRSFFRILLSSCDKSVKSEARAVLLAEKAALESDAAAVIEATPAPYPELDPHPQVIDTLSRIFGQMVEIKAELPEAYIVIEKFLAAIKDHKYSDDREKRYFMVIHEYIQAPFRDYLEEEAQAARIIAAPTPDAAVDEFFE